MSGVTISAGNVQLDGIIKDTNGGTLVNFGVASPAANFVAVLNSVSGSPAAIQSQGSDTNVDLKLYCQGTGHIQNGAGTFSSVTTDTDGATVTFDLSASNIHQVTLGGNRTLALSNAKAGQVFTLRLIQDATGSRTVTWFSGIKWPNNIVPTLTTTASKTDTFIFLCTSTGNFDGYTLGQNL